MVVEVEEMEEEDIIPTITEVLDYNNYNKLSI